MSDKVKVYGVKIAMSVTSGFDRVAVVEHERCDSQQTTFPFAYIVNNIDGVLDDFDTEVTEKLGDGTDRKAEDLHVELDVSIATGGGTLQPKVFTYREKAPLSSSLGFVGRVRRMRDQLVADIGPVDARDREMNPEAPRPAFT